MESPIPGLGTEHRPRSKPGTTACVRCRQKKKRCDQKLPRCRPCELAGVECYGYVQSLEERVAFLESKLRAAGCHETASIASSQSPTALHYPAAASESASIESVLGSTTSPGSYTTQTGPSDITKDTFGSIGNQEQQRPNPDIGFSNILLNGLMNTQTTHQLFPDRQDQPAADIIGRLDTGPVTIPTKDIAGSLVKEFFQCANLGIPLLHEPTFTQKLGMVYDMPQIINLAETHTTVKSRIAVFFVLEVFAIALLTLQKQDPARIPTWLADRYHKVALAALMEAGLPNDIEGVQALLLIGQFHYFHTALWTTWDPVGAAFRLAVELGLHQDPLSGELDDLTLDIRRRTFWVAYSMDRNISIAKRIPSFLSDGAINAKFPSELDDSLITSEGIETTRRQASGSKLVSIHLFRYRQIQSEMRTVLYEKPPPPYEPVNLEQWQQQMRDRINMWYETIPSTDKLNERDRTVTATFELTYNSALNYLYRPSTNNPNPSGLQLVAMTQAAIKMIQLYRKFFLEKKLTIYWHAVENLCSAGTALMFGFATSAQLRDFIGFRSFESTLHACSSVLWGMVERFPAFQHKRDVFDAAVSSVLADLSTSTFVTEQRQQLSAMPTIRSSPEPRPNSWFVSNASDGEAGLDTQPLPSALMDFGDLTMVWEAAVDLSGTPAPIWI